MTRKVSVCLAWGFVLAGPGSCAAQLSSCQLIKGKANAGQRERRRSSAQRLCGQSESRDLSPALESFAELLPVDGCGKPMPPWTEMLGNGPIGREKALGLPRRL